MGVGFPIVARRDFADEPSPHLLTSGRRPRVIAARMSLHRGLAMADALPYATAISAGAHLVTSDAHFQGVPDVTVFR